MEKRAWRDGKIRGLPHAEDELEARAYRADGRCSCPVCGEPYADHPWLDNCRDRSTNAPIYNVLCNDDVVKL